ncbi:MAG: adenylate kinase [Bacillota bacterium]
MRLALVGVAGSGKGTQAARLVTEFNIPHISTGNILRDEVANKTEIGLEVKYILDVGGLVSDDLIVQITKNRLAEDDCKNGFILDGFPRTIAQADKLGAMVELDRVIYISVSDDLVLSRLTARRMCNDCGAIFNTIFMPPKKEGICDDCGAKLIQRKDDTHEAGLARLKVFYDQITPLEAYYAERNLLLKVDGEMEVEKLNTIILEALK